MFGKNRFKFHIIYTKMNKNVLKKQLSIQKKYGGCGFYFLEK